MKVDLVVLVLLFFVMALLVVRRSAFGTRPGKKDIKRFSTSRHYDHENKIFVNRRPNLTQEVMKRFRFKDYINFLFEPVGNRVPSKELPLVKPIIADFLSPSENIKVIWLGHSSFLLNMNSKIVLIDPVFNNAAPFSFMMKRFQPTPLTLEELPSVDYIVISHNHYDHLDMKTIDFFKDKNVPFLVPLGVGSSLIKWNIDKLRITEFDWWQSHQKDPELEFIFTPSQHSSGRSPFDRDETLWGSWVIRNKTQNVYFSGDSGYDIHFKEIGDKYGPFDVAFMETGQYNKLWEEIHLLPVQSVQAFLDVNTKRYFPIHWGAFNIAKHPWFEPIEEITKASKERNFPIITPKIGEIVEIIDGYNSIPWWQELMQESLELLPLTDSSTS